MEKFDKAYSISVVIITKDRTSILVETVASVLKQIVLPDELIVVDASEHDTAVESELMSVIRDKIPMRYAHTNPSTSMQRNLGAEIASSDILLFMDDDILLAKDHIEQLLRFYQAHSPYSFSGVRGINTLAYPQTSRARTILCRLFLLQEIQHGKPAKMKSSGFARISFFVNQVSTVDVAPAGCISFWRKIFLRHRFDTRFSGYVLGEDQDLAWRISRELPLYQIPFAKYQETRLQTSKSDDLYIRNKQFILMHRYFFKKNFGTKKLNKIAHYWALLGYFILCAYGCVRAKDFGALKGFFAGLTAKLPEME